MLMKTQSAPRQAATFAEAGDAVTEQRRRYMTREPADKRLLEIHVYPQLGNFGVSDIERRHVAEVLRAVRARAPKSVPRVRRCIARVLHWAVVHGLRPDNPCSSALERRVAGRYARTEPHAALPNAQVPDAVAAARSATHWIGTKLLLEFMVLTAARPGDARLARWGEINVERPHVGRANRADADSRRTSCAALERGAHSGRRSPRPPRTPGGAPQRWRLRPCISQQAGAGGVKRCSSQDAQSPENRRCTVRFQDIVRRVG